MHRPEESEKDEPSPERMIQLLVHSQRELAPRVSFPVVDEEALGMDLGE